MNSIQMYTELCKIDVINNNLESKYPYTLQDDIQFTQHEIVLEYKKNYCQNINVLEDKSQYNKSDGYKGHDKYNRSERSDGYKGHPDKYNRSERSDGYKGHPDKYNRPERSDGYKGHPDKYNRPERSRTGGQNGSGSDDESSSSSKSDEESDGSKESVNGGEASYQYLLYDW